MNGPDGLASIAFFLLGEAALPDAADTFRQSALTEGVNVYAIESGTTVAGAINDVLRDDASDFVCIVDAPGKLTSGSIRMIRRFLLDSPDADVVFGDETYIDDTGRLLSYEKPVYSPERLRCQFYLGTPVLYRRDLFARSGGLDSSLPGAELYDLALRATRSARSVQHIPEKLFAGVGYPIRGPLGAEALESTRRTLQSHMDSTGGGTVVATRESGIHETKRLVRGEPLVSIVIPTRGIYQEIDGRHRSFVVDAVRSIVSKSTYTNIEIVLVMDAVADPRAVAELRTLAGSRLKIVEWDRPFNFSEKVNYGAIHARGEYLLVLNDDVAIITPDWIESLLGLAQLPGAGMVGGMLYYGDDTIQHAGHAYWRGDASHIGLDTPRGDAGPFGGYLVEREVVGVTAACAMMPRDVFMGVGGLSHLLPGNFNDVDLCMKTTWRGYEIYWTPHAELYHFESKTRDATVRDFEVDVTWRRWGFRMHDPRYWPYPLSRPPR